MEPIEDAIRELCAGVAAADSSELPEVVADLGTAFKRQPINSNCFSALQVQRGGLRVPQNIRAELHG